MTGWKQTLEDIEKERGLKAKKAVLNRNISKDVHEFLLTCYDDAVYNVGKTTFENILQPTERHTHISDYAYKVCKGTKDLTVTDFKKLVNDIMSVGGNTNECIKLLTQALNDYNALSAKWLVRGILKDPRLGIKQKSVNDVFSGCNLDTAKDYGNVQLCGKFKVVNNKIQELDKLDYPVYCEPKVDGVRLIVMKTKGKVKLLSRNEKELQNFPELIKMFEAMPLKDFIIDGEVLSDDYYVLMTRTHRKDDKAAGIKIQFACWDMLKNANTYIDSYSLLERRIVLKATLGREQNEHFRILPNHICHEPYEVQEYFNDCLEEGYEGIIVKQNAPYVFSRSKFWLKAKPNITADLKIVGYDYGTGKYANVVSSLTVVDASGTVKTDVGSGLTDKTRVWLTRNKKTLIGRIVEIKYDTVSKERSLRFPRVIKLRDDKDVPDDLTQA